MMETVDQPPVRKNRARLWLTLAAAVVPWGLAAAYAGGWRIDWGGDDLSETYRVETPEPKREFIHVSHDPRLEAFRRDWTAGMTSVEREDGSWKARMRALHEFARLGPAEAVPILVGALEDRDASVRSLAAQALGYLGDASVAGALDRAMTDDPVSEVRTYAIFSRGMIGGMEPGPLYEQACRDEPLLYIRSHVAAALGREGRPIDPSVREALASYDLRAMDTARVGAPAPDFALAGPDGEIHRLSDYRGRKSVVLIFIFGNNCMFCTHQVESLRRAIGEFDDRDAEVLVVEAHEPYRLRLTLADVGLTPEDVGFPVLCDPAHVAAASYGLAFQMHKGVEWAARPATFVIDRHGILRYAHRSKGPADRPPVEFVLGELDQIGPGPDEGHAAD